MNIRRYALVHSILGLAVLAGCGAAPDGGAASDGEERTQSSSSALTLPSNANWAASLSPDAVVLGKDTDGTPFYSCRAPFNGSIAPGKMRANWSYCDVSYAGLENPVTPYQTLTPVWTASTYGQIPADAIPYGVQNGQPLYVCRALTPQFQWQTGKTGNGIPGCDYPYGGVEVTAPAYQVLSNKFAFDIGLQAVAQNAPLPYNAIRGGTDTNGAAIYPCIAPYDGDSHPGKTEPGWGQCDISYGGQEIWVHSSYSVLVPGLTTPPLGNAMTEYAGGTDTDGSTLGVCTASYGGAIQVGKYISAGACDFPYQGREVALTTGGQLLAFHEDTSPVTETFDISFPGNIALGGNATITMKDDGTYVFAGALHDSGAISYTDSVLMVIRTSNGVAFTFGRSGSAKGTVDCPIFSSCSGRDDNWTTTGTNPAIAQHWGDLKKGVSWTAQASVAPDFGLLWSDAQAAVGDAQQVIAVVGPLLPLL